MGPLEDTKGTKSALPFGSIVPQPTTLPGLAPPNGEAEDIDMREAGPTTAPLQQGSTFLHD